MTTPNTVDVVRTRRLEVVDEDGVVRIVLHCQRDIDGDSAMVDVYDPKGRLAMSLSNDGDESRVEWWQRGNPVLIVTSDRDGAIGVEVASAENAFTPALEWKNETAGGSA